MPPKRAGVQEYTRLKNICSETFKLKKHLVTNIELQRNTSSETLVNRNIDSKTLNSIDTLVPEY